MATIDTSTRSDLTLSLPAVGAQGPSAPTAGPQAGSQFGDVLSDAIGTNNGPAAGAPTAPTLQSTAGGPNPSSAAINPAGAGQAPAPPRKPSADPADSTPSSGSNSQPTADSTSAPGDHNTSANAEKPLAPADKAADQPAPTPTAVPGAPPPQLLINLLGAQPAPADPPQPPPPAGGSTSATNRGTPITLVGTLPAPPPAFIAALNQTVSVSSSAGTASDPKPQSSSTASANVSTTEDVPGAVSPASAVTVPSAVATANLTQVAAAATVVTSVAPVPLDQPAPTPATAGKDKSGSSDSIDPNQNKSQSPEPVSIAAALPIPSSASVSRDTQHGAQSEPDSQSPPNESAGPSSAAIPFAVPSANPPQPPGPFSDSAGNNSTIAGLQLAAGTALPATGTGTGAGPAANRSADDQTAAPGQPNQDAPLQAAGPANPLLGVAPLSFQFPAGAIPANQPPVTAANPAQVITQVAHALVSYRGGQEMQLQLSPPDLGTVRIDVAMHDGVLSARLEAQSPATQQMLTDNLSQLKDSLAQQGVSFDRIDVKLAGPEPGTFGSTSTDASFGRQQGNSQADQEAGFAFIDPEEAPSPTARAPLTRASTTSLDITI